MSKLQVKIDGEWKDFCGIKETDYSVSWIRNLSMLKNGEFGDTKLSETLLAYWKAQYAAGYPSAEGNVRYFEDMVRKESGGLSRDRLLTDIRNISNKFTKRG